MGSGLFGATSMDDKPFCDVVSFGSFSTGSGVLTASKGVMFLWNLHCALLGVANAGFLIVWEFAVRIEVETGVSCRGVSTCFNSRGASEARQLLL